MKANPEHYKQARKLMECSKTNAAALVRKAMRADGDEVAVMLRKSHASISDLMERIEFRTRYGKVIKQFY